MPVLLNKVNASYHFVAPIIDKAVQSKFLQVNSSF